MHLSFVPYPIFKHPDNTFECGISILVNLKLIKTIALRLIPLSQVGQYLGRPPPQAGQTNPCGQRRSNKNAAQLVSAGKLV